MLRPYVPADRDLFVSLFTDPEFTRYIDGVRTPEAAGSLFDGLCAGENPRAVEAFAVLEGATCVGHAVIFRTDDEDALEIGYGLHRTVWGRGLGTATATALLDRVRTLGVRRAVATVDLENEASIRLLTRLGGTAERIEDDEGPYLAFSFSL